MPLSPLPLPNLVLIPDTLLPLKIFEPRSRAPHRHFAARPEHA